MEKPIIRLDKIKDTAHVVSVKAHKDYEQGNMVALGELQGEVYEGKDIEANSDLVVLIACSTFKHDESLTDEEFYIKKDELARGYIMSKGDTITLTDNGLEGNAEIDKYVVPKAGNIKMSVVDSKPTKGVGVCYKIIAKSYLAGYQASKLLVVSE